MHTQTMRQWALSLGVKYKMYTTNLNPNMILIREFSNSYQLHGLLAICTGSLSLALARAFVAAL